MTQRTRQTPAKKWPGVLMVNGNESVSQKVTLNPTFCDGEVIEQAVKCMIKWIGNVEDAKDAVQEALVYLLCYDGKVYNPVGLIIRIAKWRFLSEQKQKFCQAELADCCAMLNTSIQSKHDASDAVAELNEMIHSAGLTALEHQVLTHQLAGYTFLEIGEITKSSRSSAHRASKQAISKLIVAAKRCKADD